MHLTICSLRARIRTGVIRVIATDRPPARRVPRRAWRRSTAHWWVWSPPLRAAGHSLAAHGSQVLLLASPRWWQAMLALLLGSVLGIVQGACPRYPTRCTLVRRAGGHTPCIIMSMSVPERVLDLASASAARANLVGRALLRCAATTQRDGPWSFALERQPDLPPRVHDACPARRSTGGALPALERGSTPRNFSVRVLRRRFVQCQRGV